MNKPILTRQQKHANEPSSITFSIVVVLEHTNESQLYSGKCHDGLTVHVKLYFYDTQSMYTSTAYSFTINIAGKSVLVAPTINLCILKLLSYPEIVL